MGDAQTETARGAQDARDGDLVIAEIAKNAAEVVKVRRTVYNGVPLIDARVWLKPAVPGDEAKPTKKGLCLRPETWRELARVILAEVGEEASGE